MPRKAKTPCRQQGCRVLLDEPGYCVDHQRAIYKQTKQLSDEEAKERNRFYQRKSWKMARVLHLQSEPLCRECKKHGRLVAAEVVDHVIPITKGGDELYDGNLQSLCKSCHNNKTSKESGFIRGG